MACSLRRGDAAGEHRKLPCEPRVERVERVDAQPLRLCEQPPVVLAVAHDHGARSAAYALLRLPYELKDLFKDWLSTHYPLKAEHVMSRLREMRGGRENDSEFGSRFIGNGLFAQLLSKRFQLACERLGFNLEVCALDTTRFIKPSRSGQMSLFG